MPSLLPCWLSWVGRTNKVGWLRRRRWFRLLQNPAAAATPPSFLRWTEIYWLETGCLSDGAGAGFLFVIGRSISSFKFCFWREIQMFYLLFRSENSPSAFYGLRAPQWIVAGHNTTSNRSLAADHVVLLLVAVVQVVLGVPHWGREGGIGRASWRNEDGTYDKKEAREGGRGSEQGQRELSWLISWGIKHFSSQVYISPLREQIFPQCRTYVE